MLIGMLSDTHGFFDPLLRQRLAGVDHIVHCGDIGDLSVLDELRALAPLSAVVGNVDLPHLRGAFGEELHTDFAGVHCFVRRRSALAERLNAALRRELRRAGVRVFAFGHSHRPLAVENDGILYFNPGSAGRKRFRLPRTAGLLHIEQGTVRAEVFSLE